MAFMARRSRRLVTVWTLFGPMPRLSTDQAFVSCLVLQGLGVCHRASWEGGQHLGMTQGSRWENALVYFTDPLPPVTDSHFAAFGY